MRISRLDSAVAIARALGHPARLRTVAMLRTGELCVCQVIEVLKLAPSTVSAHLRELKRCGVVTDRKDGRWVHVSITSDEQTRLWVDTAMATLAEDPTVDADMKLVRELREVPVEELCRLGFEQALATVRSKVTENHGHDGPQGECE